MKKKALLILILSIGGVLHASSGREGIGHDSALSDTPLLGKTARYIMLYAGLSSSDDHGLTVDMSSVMLLLVWPIFLKRKKREFVE